MSSENSTPKWSNKTVSVPGFTAGLREKEFEKIKTKMTKQGWEAVEYNDEGLTKSNAIFRRPLNYTPPKKDHTYLKTFVLFSVFIGLSSALPISLSLLLSFACLIVIIPSPVREELTHMVNGNKWLLKAAKIGLVAFLLGGFSKHSTDIQNDNIATETQQVEQALQNAELNIQNGKYQDALNNVANVTALKQATNAQAAMELYTQLLDFNNDNLEDKIYKLNRVEFNSLLAGKLNKTYSSSASLNAAYLTKMKRAAPKVKKEFYKRIALVEKVQKAQDKIAIEAALQKKKFGSSPQVNPWDGSYYAVEKYLEAAANDPDSLKFAGCTKVLVDNQKGYVVGCDYRLKNGFGALIKNSNWFVIRHEQVVERLPASAYSN